MGATTEDQNHSSKSGSNQKPTLYDEYQQYLSSQSQDKSGHRLKDKKQDGSASAEPPPAADPNGDAAQNNSGGRESLPLKKRVEKIYEPPHAVRGFEKDEMSLEIMLIQDGCPGSLITIGVVGQRGVGKTTLCRKILKNERVKGSYSKMFRIILSEVPRMEETEFTVADDGILELTTAADGVPTRLNNDNLNQQLKEGKYIIVFDDVGEAEEDEYYQKLKDCVNGLPNEKGGAVIVTCRSEKAAQKLVGDENLHRLEPLNNPDSCWWIYNEAVRREVIEEDRTVSKDVKEELMKRCGGLPWAARMMGEIKRQQLSDDKNKANQTNSTPVS
ncbi:hypothetical protein V6N13_036157 [Hibiscus sabdariffa]|uniref:AAA+ ATPase domain-containing protein n=1 Tax=Hibiscus sabdariffa TaxID=183260 RepID=A0ABR2S7M4_9ROSI